MQALDELRRHLLSLRKPFIVGHDRADPDAVASAYGLSEALSAPIGFPSLSSEGKRMLEVLGAPYELMPDLRGYDVILVDTSSPHMLGRLSLEGISSLTVIDHHRTGESLKGRLFIFPEAAATSEIILKLFPNLSKGAKEALIYGIYVDTGGLLHAKPQTLRLVAQHLTSTLRRVVSRFSKRPNVSERIARLKALRDGSIVRIGDMIVAYAEIGSFEGSVASLLVTAGAHVGMAFSEETLSIRLSEEALAYISADEIAELLGRLGISCGVLGGALGCRVNNRGREAAEAIIELLSKRVGASVVRRY